MVKFEFMLPCKFYVAHYLKSKFGDPVYLRRDSDIGKYFFSLLEDANTEDDHKYEKNSKHNSEVRIMITESVFLKKGCVLTKTNTVYFNRYIENDFKKQVNLYLDALVEVNDIQIKKAIDYVYDRFDMDETIFPMETIVKQYYRDRQQRNKLIVSDKKKYTEDVLKKI